MAKNGLGLAPDALPDSFSRGHPLLFFFIGALWVEIFGSSFFSMHLFALIISVAFIFTLFIVVKRLFDATLALVAATITIVQPIFIAQSALVLPEVLLALWAILTIYHFVKENKFYYFLFGTLLVLTKESGVVIIAALGIYQLIFFFTRKIDLQSLKIFILKSLVICSPILFFILFLVIQHRQRGYYFFPTHINLLKLKWHEFQEWLKYCYDYLFEKQGRAFITYSFLILFALFYKPIPAIIRLLLAFGLIACVKIFFRYWPLPDLLMILVVGGFTAIFYYVMHIKYAVENEKGGNKFLSIIFITAIFYLVFSSINFFTNRYLLVLVPLMIIYFTYYIGYSLPLRPTITYVWTGVIAILIMISDIAYSKKTGDDSPKYIQAIKLERMIIEYLEQKNLQDSNLCCKFTIALTTDPNHPGFLTSSKRFSNLTHELKENTRYYVYTNLDADTILKHDNDSLPHFRTIKTFKYGVAYGKILKRND